MIFKGLGFPPMHFNEHQLCTDFHYSSAGPFPIPCEQREVPLCSFFLNSSFGPCRVTFSWSAAQWEGQSVIACWQSLRYNHMFHTALFYFMCGPQKAATSINGNALTGALLAWRGNTFLFDGIGKAVITTRRNYQRLLAAPPPGMEWLSQGYDYFQVELFWQADSTFE